MRALRVIQQRTAATRERVRAVVVEALVEGDVVEATRRAHRQLDAEIARAIARDPGNAPACAAGCSYCCHVHVDATPAEVSLVAEHLRANRSATELAALVQRLTAHVEVAAALDHQERWRAKLPCALLGEGGACTVHEARPLRCRAFHSSSADPCREAFIGTSETGASEPEPARNVALDRACEAAEEGLDAALAERGVSAEPVLLEPALLAVLLTAPSPNALAPASCYEASAPCVPLLPPSSSPSPARPR